MDDIDNGRVALGRTHASAASQRREYADVDLTGIDPVHWAETRERVAILRAWCANGRHPRSEALAAAERMGVTVSHFYRLVAAWKKHRDARRVSGHPTRRGDTREPRSDPTEAQAIMNRVINERGTEARFTDVLTEVRSVCARAGVAAPSSSLVHKMMMRARQAPASGMAWAVDDVALAVVNCLLPVIADGGTVDAPDLVLAVERPGGIIVGHHLVTSGNATAEAREMLACLTASTDRHLLVAATLAGAVDLDAESVGSDISPTGTPRARAHEARIEVVRRSTLLSTTLGSYIDSIPIRHRRRPDRAPGPWKPLSPADAVAAVDLAVAAHNAARRG